MRVIGATYADGSTQLIALVTGPNTLPDSALIQQSPALFRVLTALVRAIEVSGLPPSASVSSIMTEARAVLRRTVTA